MGLSKLKNLTVKQYRHFLFLNPKILNRKIRENLYYLPFISDLYCLERILALRSNFGRGEIYRRRFDPTNSP